VRLVGVDPKVAVALGADHRRGDDGGSCGGRTSVIDVEEKIGSKEEADDVQGIRNLTPELDVSTAGTEVDGRRRNRRNCCSGSEKGTAFWR
jgi:hypothetical protein